jgi:hypothetical protein
LAQEAVPNGIILRIDLSRTDLQEGIKTTPVSPPAGPSPIEWVPEQGGGDALRSPRPWLDAIGPASTPLPLANAQQPPEPQQPTMSPGGYVSE